MKKSTILLSLACCLSIISISCMNQSVNLKHYDLKNNISNSNLKLSKGSTLANFKEADIKTTNIFKLENLSRMKRANIFVYVTLLEGASPKASDIYMYAFKNDLLVYWGYVYQFRKNDNELVRELGDEAFSYIIKDKDLKNEFE